MDTPDPSSPAADGDSRRTRWIIAAGIAAVVVVGVILIVKLLSGDSASPSAAPTTSATPTASSTASASPSARPTKSASPTGTGKATATAKPSAKPTATPTPTPSSSVSPTPPADETPRVLPTRKPVPIKSAAPFGDGVTAHIDSIVPVRSTGVGPGEISGPAIKVGITIHNGTADPLVLAQTTVNAYYGPRQTPATAIFGDPSSKPFTGTAAPGASAKGVYVFDVPRTGRGDVTITVSYAPLSPIVVFKGPVR